MGVSMKHFIGIDLGKKSAAVCVMDEHGSILREFEFPVDKTSLGMTAKLLPQASSIVIENSTNAFAVFQILRAAGHNVVMSEPVMTKAIANAKLKTDKVDAKTLANLLRCEYLPTVWVPDQETYEMRLLTSHRVSLQRSVLRLKNKIHSILSRNLITYEFSDLFGLAGRKWLKSLKLPSYEQIQMQTCMASLEALEAQLEIVEKDLAKRSYNKPEVNLLMSITGLDYLSAITIIASIGIISRFAHPKKLGSYFGIVPTVYQSGQSEYHGRITKRGNVNVRWTLVQCANVAVKHDEELKVFYRRIKAKKGHNVAVVAAADKLSHIIWHMLMKNEPYRRQKPHLLEHKQARLRIDATGVRFHGGANAKNPNVPKVQGGSNSRKRASDTRKTRSTDAQVAFKPIGSNSESPQIPNLQNSGGGTAAAGNVFSKGNVHGKSLPKS